MKIQLAPSLMCSDFRNLESEIRLFERKGIELLHLDIMDGRFVPNITMGPPVVKAIAAMTRLTLDIHLMLSAPEDFIPVMASVGRPATPRADKPATRPAGKPATRRAGKPATRRAGKPIISVHVESGRPLKKLIHSIRKCGARPAVAINPCTPLAALEPVLGDVELILMMCVQPGFAGQKLVPGSIERIAELKEMLKRRKVSPLIEVDGNTSFENIRRMVAAGANVIVAGTSCLYRKDKPLEPALDEFLAFLATV